MVQRMSNESSGHMNTLAQASVKNVIIADDDIIARLG